ncbi:hypothetical protein L484_020788 [Morus notabilis]|uniref:Uncharacterized protein n=1 Tax=Morus notabilis TaxID=981085 RepID=W9SJI5_9ROSA|nr:hypothetical protein L484_020788 [Morus notabilis]
MTREARIKGGKKVINEDCLLECETGGFYKKPKGRWNKARKRGMIKENLNRIKPEIVILQETKRETLNERMIGSLWRVRS